MTAIPSVTGPAMTAPDGETIMNGNAMLDNDTIIDDEKCQDYVKALRNLKEDRTKKLLEIQNIDAAEKALESQLQTQRESLWSDFRQTVENIVLDELTQYGWQ